MSEKLTASKIEQILLGRAKKSFMTVNTRCLTVKILECRKTENECSLSDILEGKVDEKYFLSREQAQKILKSLRKG